MDISTYLTNTGVKQSDFARSIGVPPSMLYQWLRGLRPVAAKHCTKIEQQTGGKVTRRELRPDDWHSIWPELARTKRRRPAQIEPPP
jgi:DNA-binding transcriptional regulator YdaS (Cro superfamily)